MSTTLRGIIIIFCILTFVSIIAYQRINNTNITKRSYAFLFCTSILFPFLDLGISVGGFYLKVFNVACTTFLIFNFNTLYKLAKKYYLIIIYVILMVITSISSDFKVESLLAIPDKLKPAIIFLSAIIIFDDLKENNRLQLFAKLMKWPIIMTIFFGLMQIFISQHFTVFYSLWDKEARISSCYIDPQIAGCSIAMLAVYSWNKFLSNKNNISLLIFGLLSFIGLYTGSKVFILGLILGVCTSFMFTQQKIKYTLIIIFFGFILVLTESYWSQLYIFERLGAADDSFEIRKEYFWLVAIEIFKNNWLTGIGSGVFHNYIEFYKIPMTHNINGVEEYAFQPESGYLLWLDEMGILSIIYIIILLYFILNKYGNKNINLSIITPWLIAFISLYNFNSNMLIYILFITLALIFVQTKNKNIIKS